MESKSVFASKTFWVNTIALIATLAGAFGLDLGLDAEAQASIAVGVMAVVNVILRLTTTRPVHLKKPEGNAASTRLGSLAFALISAALTVTVLNACTYRIAETPAQKVFALEGEFQSMQRLVLAYVDSDQADPEIKNRLKQLTEVAFETIDTARTAVMAGDDARWPAAFAAATAAVRELTKYFNDRVRKKGAIDDGSNGIEVSALDSGHHGGDPGSGRRLARDQGEDRAVHRRGPRPDPRGVGRAARGYARLAGAYSEVVAA